MRASAWLLVIFLCGAFAQSPAGRPGFEVASIKPGNPESRQLRSLISEGGRLRAENVSLRVLIEDAYQLKPFQLMGGPRWMDSDKFEVLAKGEEPATIPQVRLMLQSLLAERFQLAMHRETKEQTIYVLSTKGSLKLQLSKEEGKDSMMISTKGIVDPVTHVAFKNTTMTRLADILSRQLGQIVEDRTGLSGQFDFEFDATRDDGERNPFSAPYAPFISEVGLKLDSHKGPVEIFIVDRAEKPSEN